MAVFRSREAGFGPFRHKKSVVKWPIMPGIPLFPGSRLCAMARMMLRIFAGHLEGPASVCGGRSPVDQGIHPAWPGRPAGTAGMISRALEIEKLWKYGAK